MNQPDCSFCRQLAGLDPLPEAGLVWRFPHSLAVLGRWQFYRGYCVLIARRHARELHDLADHERRGYLEEMCLLARAIAEGLRPHKLNYELLGNQVPHLHWHLFPRALDDPARLDPVWLAVDRAGRNPQHGRLLEGEPLARPDTIRLLQQSLTALDAPRA
jgi:diadenosine tetraphosphate (Ap4A) HIT family hydrolase